MSNSQERLSEEEIQRFERFYSGEIQWAADPDDVKLLLTEVKRLQAVEATVYDLEASVKLLINQNKRLREVIDKQHIQLDQYESLLNEGAVNHE